MSNKQFSVNLTQVEIIAVINAINSQFVQWSKLLTQEQIQNAPDDSAIGNLRRVQAQLSPMINW